MRAVYADTFGGENWLSNLCIGDVVEPIPGLGEALVKVEAASLNHHDLWTLKGVSSGRLERRQVLGCDAAGTVVAYGDEPPQEAPPVGGRVVVHAVISCGGCRACLAGSELGCPRVGILSDPGLPGTCAEFLVVPARNLVALPDSVSLASAACLPTAYLTAYRMLFTRARVKPGDSVVVQGASGGVAVAALQLGLIAGLRVHVTSRDAAKRQAALDLGASGAHTTDRDSVKAIIAATDGGADAVIETVGEATFDHSLRITRPGGTVVVAGTTTGANPPAQLNRIFWRQLTIAGSTMGHRTDLVALVRLCAESGLRPLIDSSYPLADAEAAFARLASGAHHGKVGLTPGPA